MGTQGSGPTSAASIPRGRGVPFPWMWPDEYGSQFCIRFLKTALATNAAEGVPSEIYPLRAGGRLRWMKPRESARATCSPFTPATVPPRRLPCPNQRESGIARSDRIISTAFSAARRAPGSGSESAIRSRASRALRSPISPRANAARCRRLLSSDERQSKRGRTARTSLSQPSPWATELRSPPPSRRS